MKWKSFLFPVVVALFLSACSALPFDLLPSPEAQQPTEVGDSTPVEGPQATEDLDAPVAATPDNRPARPGPTLTPTIDLRLIPAEASVISTDLRVLESFPVQPVLTIRGSLPTPCHSLKVDIQGPDDEKNIYVQVSSLLDPGQMCAQVIEPFEADLRMDDLNLGEGGQFTVYVGEREAGSFTYP